jgi:hypothetical protein
LERRRKEKGPFPYFRRRATMVFSPNHHDLLRSGPISIREDSNNVSVFWLGRVPSLGRADSLLFYCFFSMIKNIVERPSGTPSAPSPPTVPSAPTPNGFPKALHRSQRPTPSVSSAFRKSRANPPPERQVEAPRVQSVPPAEGQLGGFGRGGDDTEDMMRSRNGRVRRLSWPRGLEEAC